MFRNLLFPLACLLCVFSHASSQLKKNEIPPEFIGGAEALNKLLYEHIKYPRTALKMGIGGKVVVQYIVDSSGRVRDISIVESVHEDIDAEAMRVIALTSGKWKPGWQDGRRVSVQFRLPITFTPGGVVFEDVEKEPVYPGGENALDRHIYKTLRYPKKAIKDGIEGTVIMRFKIDANGKVSEITVNKGLRGDVDNEALRIVSKLRDWEPAKQNGQNVAVTFLLPIRFTITPAMRPLLRPKGSSTPDDVYN